MVTVEGLTDNDTLGGSYGATTLGDRLYLIRWGEDEGTRIQVNHLLSLETIVCIMDSSSKLLSMFFHSEVITFACLNMIIYEQPNLNMIIYDNIYVERNNKNYIQ